MIKFKHFKFAAIFISLTSIISVSSANTIPTNLPDQCYTDITMPFSQFYANGANYAATLNQCVQYNVCSLNQFSNLSDCSIKLGTRNYIGNFLAVSATVNPKENYDQSFGNFSPSDSQMNNAYTPLNATVNNNDSTNTKTANSTPATSNSYIAPIAPSNTSNTSNSNSNSTSKIHWF